MPGIDPPVIRSIITDDEFGGFRITIPAPEGGRCGFSCGLAFWAVVMAFTVLGIVSDPSRNFAVGIKFLVVWAFLGFLLAFGLAYAWTGRQVIMIEGKTLIVRWEIAGHSQVRTFDLAGVRNLKLVRSNDRANRSRQRGAVAFDHGGMTHQFGVGLSEIEAIRLIKTIRQRFNIRDDLDDAEPLPIVK